MHLLWAVVSVLRGQHLLARLLCGCLCGAARITGRPFTPAQTAIRSPSPSPALSSIILLLWFSPNPPCPACQIVINRTLSFTSPMCQSVCLSVCAPASVWPLPFLLPHFSFATISLPPTLQRNINSSCNSATVKYTHTHT